MSLPTKNRKPHPRPGARHGLSRRAVQGSQVEKSGNWYVVRLYKDVEGQKRGKCVHERVCPVAGPGYLDRYERERRAEEIIADSGVRRGGKRHAGLTFKEQTKVWLKHVQTRRRRRYRSKTIRSVHSALSNWILPELGHLQLYETTKYPVMKTLVAKMTAGGLSSQSVNSYFRMAAAIVAFADDADGNPLYTREWDPNRLDLPLIENAKRRRPWISAEIMTELARAKNHKYRMLFILAASTGCRIGELMGLEIKDVLDDFTTIRITQQAQDSRLTTDLKSVNAFRSVDLCPQVATLLRKFVGRRTVGLVFPNIRGRPLNQTNIRRTVIHPVLKRRGLPVGGFQIFRRFRMTWLRENSVHPDIERYWFGHANHSVGDDYSTLNRNIRFRKKIAERIGVGFDLPRSVSPLEVTGMAGRQWRRSP